MRVESRVSDVPRWQPAVGNPACFMLARLGRGNLEHGVLNMERTPSFLDHSRHCLEKFVFDPILTDPTKFSLSVCSGLRSQRKSLFEVTPRSKLPCPALHIWGEYILGVNQ